ncbi:MAG TPA: hypothetical protein VM553_18700, partial [Dongiaceae bacterium]|nr:hypothetical protein [Dongiaceae bacterium]
LSESTLGLQLDFNPNGEWGGTIQLMGKDTVDDSTDDAVTWAFLRYRFNPDLTLRVGRVGVDQYMLSEYRNVGFSYLWSRPPVEFYTMAGFDFFDGVDLAWTTSLSSGTLMAKLQVGQIRNTFEVQGNEVELKLSPIVGGSLHWESDRWQARISASKIRFDESYDYFPGTDQLAQTLDNPALTLFWPQASAYSDDFKLDDPYIYYFSAGAAYNNDAWNVQWESNYINSHTDFYPSVVGSYLSVGRRTGPVTPFVLGAWAESQDDRSIVAQPASTPFPELNQALTSLAGGLQTVRDLAPIDQHSLSLGVRWDVRYDIALKAQWDHTWVKAYSAGLWEQKAVPQDDTELNTFSINLNCIF